MAEKPVVKKLAIITGVSYGWSNQGVCLSFTTYVSEAVCAWQSLSAIDASLIIEAYRVADVKDLNGLPCWVMEGENIIYHSPCVICVIEAPDCLMGR